MAAEGLLVGLITAFWAAIGVLIPMVVFAKNLPNKGVISVVAALVGFCCWLFWVLAYMHQMNPLIGPLLEKTVVFALLDTWDQES